MSLRPKPSATRAKRYGLRGWVLQLKPYEKHELESRVSSPASEGAHHPSQFPETNEEWRMLS